MEHSDCLYAVSIMEQSFRKPPVENAPSQQMYFQTNCQSVFPMLVKSIEATLFEHDFADLGYVLHIFFVTKSTTFLFQHSS